MVSFKTKGYGGRTMKKNIQVETDDPLKQKFNLVVTGSVEKVVEIKPSTVYLDGKPGDTLSSVVTIMPSEKYPFSILELKQKINSGITAKLIQPKNGEKFWQIEIQSKSDKEEDLYDKLTLKTDSDLMPEITVRVYAIFLQKKDSSS